MSDEEILERAPFVVFKTAGSEGFVFNLFSGDVRYYNYTQFRKLGNCHPTEFQDVIDVHGGFIEDIPSGANSKRVSEPTPFDVLRTNVPYMIDCFPFEKVLLFHSRSEMAFLDQHPDHEKYQENFTSGEFVTFLGPQPDFLIKSES
jgi:hypothetical protein